MNPLNQLWAELVAFLILAKPESPARSHTKGVDGQKRSKTHDRTRACMNLVPVWTCDFDLVDNVWSRIWGSRSAHEQRNPALYS